MMDYRKKLETTESAEIFVSYSHKDHEWLEQFLTMLKPYVQKNGISIWSDKEIVPGSRWRKKIAEALDSARVAVLLVSPDFLASEFIQQNELPVLMSAEQEGRITIQWIAVRPSLYEETPIAEFQALNDPSTPLATVEARSLENELVKVCYRLKRALVEKQRAVEDNVPLRRLMDKIDAGPQMIQRKLLELEEARRKRDLFLTKTAQEIMDHKKELLPGIEGIDMLHFTLLKLSEGFEEHLKYDVTLLATIEAIRNSGLEPSIYDLPSFDEALQQFRSHKVEYNQYAKVRDAQKEFEKMMRTPIREIRVKE
jgi:hypothetical protein